ncbi:MAG: CPBP family intramembrane glutamic endopeptidase [Prochlorotrichaceae cyanobacterium]|jgi:membrane protease YdiL (CAAX protease family)
MTSLLTPQRIFLGLMTVFVTFLLGTELFSTLQESQIQDRLELYQTRLVLQASQWQATGASNGFSDGVLEIPQIQENPQDAELTQRLRASLVGENPIGDALAKYQALTQSLAAKSEGSETDPLGWSRDEIDRLYLEQGLLTVLDAESNQPLTQRLETAQTAWQQVAQTAEANPEDQQTAEILQGLWQTPPRLLPAAQETLTNGLEGWFRYRSLERLYEIQQRPEAIVKLWEKEQATVQRVLRQLFVLTGLPLMGMVLGTIVFLGVLLRGLWQRWQTRPVLPPAPSWTVPWNAETIWQGIVLGFFLVGQIAVVRLIIPILALSFRQVVGVSFFQTVKVQALLVVVVYGGMSIAVLTFFYFLLRPFWPFPEGWFRIRFEWRAIGWGILGYLMALPLVTLVSLLNQQLWDGQGGSNPMLFLALRNQDWFALGCFFFTAALLAPLFEEWLFRGFLMASLTRYVPPYGAILLSGLIFALAHLSLSEILPLWALGSLLGYVYGRSQNLVSAIVLHSLWNSGTLIGLTVLGSQL